MTYFASQSLNLDEVRIVAQSDESVTSSTTLQDDNELFFTADANSYYEITILAIVTSTSATPDFKYALTTLTDADWLLTGHYADQNDGGVVDATLTPFTEDTTTTQVISVPASSVETWVKLNGSYITAGTSGTVYFRWAQNTSDAAAVVRELGSHMIVRKIG